MKNLSWIVPSIIATLIGTIVLALLYWAIYRAYRERFLWIWAVSWSALSLRFVFELMMQYLPGNSLVVFAQQSAMISSGSILLWGTYAFLGRTMPKWLISIVPLGVAWIVTGLLSGFSWLHLNVPISLVLCFIYAWIGWVLLRSVQIEGLGKVFAGWAFIIWGVHKLSYPLLESYDWIGPWGYLISTILEFMVASGTLLIYFERTRRNLSQSEERFRLLADNAKDLIYRLRLVPSVEFEYVSPSCTGITGYKPEEYYQNYDFISEIIHAEDQDFLNIEFVKNLPQDRPHILRWKHKDGRYVWLEQRIGLTHREGGSIDLEVIARDITERKLAEDALKRYELLSKYARDVILFLRYDGLIVEVNEAAVREYGYTREELLGNNASILRAPAAKSILNEQLKQAESEAMLFETMHQRKDGTIFPVEVSLQGVIFSDEQVYFGIVRDITDRKLAEETINHLAYHDPLTDLPNRILFFDRLSVALSHAHRNHKKLSVMFLDLDRFKVINDMMGHAVGDTLLKEVATRLKNCIRSNDTVARMGGDEFTILLPEISKEEDAGKVAKKINEVLKVPWGLNGYELQISASIGITIYPNDGEDAETLTKNADTAMYRAKEKGDNYQFFTPALNTKDVERLEMEMCLRKALENEDFEIYYQPQVDIRKGDIVGVEALLRWNRPGGDMVNPLEFIPLAEGSGLIIPIGEWVLRRACLQNQAWQEAGFPSLRIAVNISAYQFRQKDFVESVSNILQETGMDPRLLELEITESTVMNDVDFTVEILTKLREMGIGIAIDDFGTGYSSLSYLKRFPITTLKIDRSFVGEVLTDIQDAAIVATIIVLAHNLRLNVIVEGVENDQQLSFFEQQECFEMQGFLFSEPITNIALEEMFRRRKNLSNS